MKTRRNYYRLLRVQPDASLEIIKHSYRTLMQTLQHHPDLGGDEWEARHINMAYATLRDPVKRAHYDRELFQRHNIETLSRGNIGPSAKTIRTGNKQTGNQRNYYRVLQIQPDAELAIIEASYKLLKRQPNADRSLLDEAWKTLHSEIKRRQYDRQLKDSNRVNHSDNTQIKPQQKNQQNVSDTNHRPQQQNNKNHAYHEHSSQYCLFCKTPYSHNDYAHQHEYCDKCGSPLLLLAEGLAKLPRRGVARANVQRSAVIYNSWPGNPSRVYLSDLSPTGLSFISEQTVGVGHLVKIDAEEFKAIAEIKYCKAIGPPFKIGVRFITVQFLRQRGSFFSSSA